MKTEMTIFFSFLIALIIHQASDAQMSLDVVQLFEAVGERAGSMLGYEVAGIGDQNGDEFDDILAGAPGDRKAFIYFGGSPMDTIPDVVFHEENENFFGRVCGLGDINGDSFIDFSIGSAELMRIYLGGAKLDTLPDLILPWASNICISGDVNGDGYDDILISNVNWQSSQGRASLYFGGEEPDSTADWIVVGDSARYYLGYGIAENGDINGDGFDDIAIGGWRKSGSYTYINIYYGGAEIDTIPAFSIDESAWPINIAPDPLVLLDVNDDDFSDLCVRSGPDFSAALLYGPILPNIILDLTLPGSSLSGRVWEISEAGDINNDGHPDIIIGNYDGWGSCGEVLVFLGGPYMDGAYDIGFTGFMHSYIGAGRSVGKAGDVNGDGVDDILFGALEYFGDTKHGRVMIFSGDTTLTAVSSEPLVANEPISFCLQQNYPNPFNESTFIEYEILSAQPKRTVVKIYNILGQEVVTLVDDLQASGHHCTSWNGKDESGKDVGSGIYLCRLQVGNSIRCNKMLLLK